MAAGNSEPQSPDAGRQLRQRRAAADRLPPLEDGRRDTLEPKPVRRRLPPRNVVGITQKGGRALIRGGAAVELLDAVGAPKAWSRAGRGWVVEARWVADLLACAETRRIFVAMGRADAA